MPSGDNCRDGEAGKRLRLLGGTRSLRAETAAASEPSSMSSSVGMATALVRPETAAFKPHVGHDASLGRLRALPDSCPWPRLASNKDQLGV